MIYIAHRGNLKGPNEIDENKPEYLLEAINKGYYVETDLWKIGNDLFLGHDKPTYKIEISFLLNIKQYLFCHCKNIDALYYIIQNHTDIECFHHHSDECVLTSKNHLWNYPGTKLTNLSICVMPEYVKQFVDPICYGVCSDYVYDIQYNGFLK